MIDRKSENLDVHQVKFLEARESDTQFAFILFLE